MSLRRATPETDPPGLMKVPGKDFKPKPVRTRWICDDTQINGATDLKLQGTSVGVPGNLAKAK